MKNRAIWAEYVTSVDPSTWQFSVAKGDLYFGELSEAEETTLKEVVQEIKDLKPFGLVDWIHENCREWVNPRGTSTYLDYKDVFKALGKDNLDKQFKHVKKIRQLAAVANAG